MSNSELKKEKNGDVSALLRLCREPMKKSRSLALALLCDGEAASEESLRAAKQTVEAVLEGKLSNKEEAENFFRQKVLSRCKARLLQKDSRAFKIPVDKNFSASFSASSRDSIGLLSALPPLFRALTVFGFLSPVSEKEAASFFNCKEELVSLALRAQRENWEKFASQTEKEALLADFSSREGEDASLEAALEKRVQELVRPQKERIRRKNRLVALVSASVFAVLAIVGGIIWGVTRPEPYAGDCDWEGRMKSITHYAVMEIENYGTITMALDGESAPITVENFVKLAKNGFYDGLTFHRIIDDFVMQGGDPQGTGAGGSGEEIKGEFYANGVENFLTHIRGAVAMARSEEYDSASSQFYITHKDSHRLDGLYAVFGYVVDGMPVVDAVCSAARPKDDNGSIAIDDQPVIYSITVYTAEEYAALNPPSQEGTAE